MTEQLAIIGIKDGEVIYAGPDTIKDRISAAKLGCDVVTASSEEVRTLFGQQVSTWSTLRTEVVRLNKLIHTPHTNQWMESVKLEAAFQQEKRNGGYYIQDLRSPIGNCMKFWYQSGYGTKHKKFFWCETYEKAQKYQGGCDWFKIWYAPYIDSLVELTVDVQFADRDQEKAMIKSAQEASHAN